MLFVSKSRIRGAGNGVFARTDILSGIKLGTYTGNKISYEKYSSLRDKSYIWQINDNLFMDGHPKHEACGLLSYVNGAKTPTQRRKINTRAYIHRQNIHYKTITSVKKGDEIIVDYGEFYWI